MIWNCKKKFIGHILNLNFCILTKLSTNYFTYIFQKLNRNSLNYGQYTYYR